MATNSQLNDTDLEKFTLIWLDAAINESENRTTQNNLRKLSDQFKPFDNSNECQLHIQSLSIDERVVLIVSGRLGREIVPNIHEIEQIYLIYVYCYNKEANERWAKDYSKIKIVVTTAEELVAQIRQDNKREISPINNELLYINIYRDNPDDQFIHSQLLINYLIKMKIYSIIDPKIFILCKTEYPEENLDDFQENYSSENSLWWITKDKFLSKLISKSFHTKNLDLLYLTCFYLRDINQQLELHQCTTRIQVYHSHLITNEEIEQLKNSIGKLISINTFFFTTFQRDNALRAFEQTNESEKILFEIDADPSIDGIKPFANIKSFSYSKKQSQIVFMLGTIFRIKKIFQQNNIWICQMNLSSENDEDLKNIFQQIQKEDGDSSTDILAFGNILARINQCDHAEKYYQYILKELPTNHANTHICYRNLGNIAYLKKDYDQSLEYHLKSLEIKKYLLKSDDPSLADSYNYLGIVSFDKTNYKQAIDYYEKGLNILELKLDENHSKIVIYLNKIALVYRMEENYLKALDYYRKILDIEKRYLTEDHSELGQTYHNIGAVYWCRGFYDDAMEYYNLSLENKYKFLPSKHSSIAMTLENMGLVYENKNDFQHACKYYQEAENIYQQTLASTHPDIIQIKDNISRVSSQLKLK
jgi:tetratricopeptide (TPR) repeat protein